MRGWQERKRRASGLVVRRSPQRQRQLSERPRLGGRASALLLAASAWVSPRSIAWCRAEILLAAPPGEPIKGHVCLAGLGWARPRRFAVETGDRASRGRRCSVDGDNYVASQSDGTDPGAT